MQIRDLKGLRDFVKDLGPKVLGLGITAFSRIAPFFLFPDYGIFCVKNTPDLSSLRRQGTIRCLEEERGYIEGPEPTSMELLSYEPYRAVLGEKSVEYLYVYQSYGAMEELSEPFGIRIIANPAQLRERLTPKPFFISLLEELKIPQLPWEILGIDEFLAMGPKKILGRFRPPFVVQVVEILRGGGRGVFFVEDEAALMHLKKRLLNKELHKVSVKGLLIRPFTEGSSMSILGCILNGKVLTGPLQHQLIDLYGPSPQGERGIFCGHSWASHNRQSGLVLEVRDLVRRVGGMLCRMGYRGIFGIDFIVNKRGIYPLEMNPRITGALPVLSLLQLMDGVIPLEYLHILSFMEPKARLDLDEIDEYTSRGVEGGQVFVFYEKKGNGCYTGALSPGLYSWGALDARRISQDIFCLDSQEPRPFWVVEGPCFPKDALEEHATGFTRTLRLVFKNGIIDDNGDLRDWVSRVINWVRGRIFGTDRLSHNLDHTSCLQPGAGAHYPGACPE